MVCLSWDDCASYDQFISDVPLKIRPLQWMRQTKKQLWECKMMLCKLTSCWLCCAHACSLAPRTSRPPVWKTTLKNITGKLDPTCCYCRTVFTLLRFSTSGQMADCCCVFLLPFFLLSKKSVVLQLCQERAFFLYLCGDCCWIKSRAATCDKCVYILVKMANSDAFA